MGVVMYTFEQHPRVSILDCRVVFVVKELSPENWINNGGVDFTVTLKQPGVASVTDKVLTAESTYSHWSLYDRFCLALETLEAADAAGQASWLQDFLAAHLVKKQIDSISVRWRRGRANVDWLVRRLDFGAGPQGMAFMLVWLRLSTNRQLDWYRNSAHQSKDIAHIQKTLAQRMTDKVRDMLATGTPKLYRRQVCEYRGLNTIKCRLVAVRKQRIGTWPGWL